MLVVKVWEITEWDNDTLIGKDKAVCASKMKWRIHLLFPIIMQVFSYSRKSGFKKRGLGSFQKWTLLRHWVGICWLTGGGKWLPSCLCIFFLLPFPYSIVSWLTSYLLLLLFFLLSCCRVEEDVAVWVFDWWTGPT